ncbi:hypothetical protein Trydic_g23851 [Trypoxylus dichotomus]
MASIETEIPAFSMWKIFYDTMKLLELDHSETKIEHLANIITTQKLTHIFVYNPDGIVSYEQSNLISQKYKAFTIWLLGKFFYLSTLNNLSGIHTLVTHVQQHILNLVLFTQPNIFHELSAEYCNGLRLLNGYRDENLMKTNEMVALELMYWKIQRDIDGSISENASNCVVSSISTTWKDIGLIVMKQLRELNCTNNCVLDNTLMFLDKILDKVVKLRMKINQKGIKDLHVMEFFPEAEFIVSLLTFVNMHLGNCKTRLPHKMFINILLKTPIFLTTSNVEIIFHLVAYPFLTLFYKTNNELPLNLSGRCDKREARTCLAEMYKNLALLQEIKLSALRNVCEFMLVLESKLGNKINDINQHNLELNFMKIYTDVYSKGSEQLQAILVSYLPVLVSYLQNLDFVPKLLLHACDNKNVVANVIRELPNVICLLSSKYVRITKWFGIDNRLNVVYKCVECNFSKDSDCNLIKNELLDYHREAHPFIIFEIVDNKVNSIDLEEILKLVWRFSSSTDTSILRTFINAFPSLSRHIDAFLTVENARVWISFAGHEDRDVRKTFAHVFHPILASCQNSKSIQRNRKEEIITLCLDELFKFTKKSLQYSNFDLQATLLETVDAISELNVRLVPLGCIKILLYFIMIPTSKHSGIAENYLLELAKKQNKKLLLLYVRYRREICQILIEICAINQALIRYPMAKSLENVSIMLGFSNAKEFVSKENSYMMPYLVSTMVLMPHVLHLIEETADLSEIDQGELLASNYGGIFLYLFLNKSEKEFKDSMKYIEDKTGMTASILRKRNFKIILNELLLNFHKKRERVLVALKLLASEDTDGEVMHVKKIPDYLQPRFLGVLQYFDTKLVAKKEVLLSLAEIFKFMGPKRIVPFRFKIIAMLRTALNLNYNHCPEIHCNVWEAFVRNCDIESLGGQLPMIFVSLLPLIEVYPSNINNIFSYLILQNENRFKDYIADLFFVLEYNVSPEIHNVVRKYLEQFEHQTSEQKLQYFMKYLSHETNEVKIHALKYLKQIIKENRSQLDQMILGYNGMDPTIVNLLEILTIGCREKDRSLKLAYSECIGELGAIEPSHLPRKYVEAQSFTFFITEDAFVVNSLYELIRALQAEKNTTIMDRFALAIQETLKIYGIGPDTSAPKHCIWKQFSQTHKELMVPFLSSRYTMGQIQEPIQYSAIFGSAVGNSFQAWSHNWTYLLISTIKTDKRKLLEVCLPSMKKSHRTLMHFLPHILLHSLLEGSPNDFDRTYEEFMAVINSFKYPKSFLDIQFEFEAPSTPWNCCDEADEKHTKELNKSHCMKVIFILLDFLERWIREWQWQRGANGRDDDNYKKICLFLTKFCKLQLAMCSFQYGEYSRALMYLEDYITNNQQALNENLYFLAKIYAQLDEPDGVSGVSALRNEEPTIEQRILELEVSGKLSDAVACYEQIPHPLKLRHLQRLIHCYLDLDNVNTALNFAEGAVEKYPEYERLLLEMEAEPLWRLGRYDDLGNLVKKSCMKDNSSWGVKIGQALLDIQNAERTKFSETLKILRLQQVDLLGATSLEEGMYQQGYESIVKLHSLNELEQIENVVRELLLKPNDHKAAESIVKNLSSVWTLRIKVVQESIKIIEPILCLRRVALNQAKRLIKDKVPSAIPHIDSLLGESWLLSAKVARRAGIHQQAYTYILKAEEYAPPKLFLERAKLHWLREEYEQALTTLTRGVENLRSGLSVDAKLNKQKMCAKAKLLIATYNDKISNVDTEVNIMHYKEALDMNKEWEKSYVSLAQYYDRIFQNYTAEDRDDKGSDMQIRMINYFGKSMLFGTNYVYQSMPKMLSIWFDYGTRLLQVMGNAKDERKQNLLKMTKLIDSFLERLPSYIFLTAFSQIISRICHPQKEVYIELKAIIIKLLLHYPQQTMWMMISVIKSGYSIRSKRCAEILGDSRLKNPTMVKLVTDFTKLAEKLIELCNKEIPETINTTNINTFLRSLPRLLSKDDFSEIMIPTQKFRKLVLPNPDFKSTQHNPFPNHYVHIIGIEDEVVILQSLQRPRKITFRGSDGKGYIQMLKPKDDLRKDFRLMEFNDIVNQMLSKEPNSRQRRLNIRLYSVVPLNEECGLIEWIPNLVGLRPILMSIYKQRGQGMRARELKEAACNLRDPLHKKRDTFEKKLLPKHPAVLNEWFRRTFPDVQGWLTARTAYTRTTAVISMVGYILGLGDRHGENILLDSISGDTVHVDFNCLFNKGETFEWPERVPFRLTHNMVSAMGTLGVEGMFRKSCACTLKVLRAHTDTLMSIVTPFVYDPLVSWPRNSSVGGNVQNAERTNEQAVEHVRDIKLRLQGMIRTRGRSYSIALSVDGQINNIIEEAMNIDNLCQMYIGWGAYL